MNKSLVNPSCLFHSLVYISYALEERTVFVGGIANSDEDDLKYYFEMFGPIAFVNIAYLPCGK